VNSTRRQVKTFHKAAIALTMLALLFAGAARPAQAQTYTPLYDFGAVDSTQTAPQGQLALGRDGNFYGTLNGNNYAEIYQITPDGVETLLWSAPARPTYEETICSTGLTLGPDGLLYGACNIWGGNNFVTGGSGIVFKFDPNAGFTVLYSFPECNSDGSLYPSALTLGTDGNFYGTTLGNSFCPNPYGTVFKVTPSGVFTTLHVFQGNGTGDGNAPMGPLTLGVDGNFYGTTQEGGTTVDNAGTVFKITPKGKFTLIHSFDSSVGYYPEAGVTQGADGKFYGTTANGGANGDGTLFQLTTAGKIAFLHSFNYPADGVAGPVNPMTLGTDGNLYGLGNCYPWGCGAESLYKITTKGVYTVLYNGFTNPGGACPDTSVTGCYLSSPMALHPNGTFYGTTMQGGDNGQPIGRGVFYSFSTGLKPYIILQFPLAPIGTTLGIFGQGFTDATAVAFNETEASFNVVSDTYLEATIPVGATTGYVTVTESSGILQSSTKFAPKPASKPAITSLAPSSAIAGGDGFTLTVNGTGFISASVVNWAGSPRATTFVSPTEITADIDAADIAKTGTYKVTVVNPANEGGTSAAVNFVVDNPAPTLISILPSSATHGSAAFTLTATGTGYIPGSVIEWNAKKLTTTYVSDTTLTATVPAADIKTAGTASITVVNPTPGGGASAAATFTIN